jgi:hypothetical protein
MFLGGGNRLEGGAPAALAHLIGIDEIIGGFSTLLAFERYGPRYAAHVQSSGDGLPLNPLHKFHGYVPVAIIIGFFSGEEERPGTKQDPQAHDSYEEYERE